VTIPRKVAVIGAGDIGVGWAALCASAGWPVAIFDLNPATMERASVEVERRTRALVALDRAPESIVERGLTELVRTEFLSEAIQDADWIIEAIHEDVLAKQKLLAAIEPLAGDDALISSSSSGLPPTEIFGRMRRLDRCLVTHPLNPPELIPIVEVVPEGRTSAASMNRAVEYLRSLGRFPIVLKKSIPGYVVGRVSAAVWRECIDLVLQGVISVDDLDRAVSLGPAIGWAAAGPHLTYHLAAGEGGIRTDPLPLGSRRDFLRRITRCQHRVHFDACLPQLLRHPLQIGPVFLHLLRLTQVELFHVARRPAVRDV